MNEMKRTFLLAALVLSGAVLATLVLLGERAVAETNTTSTAPNYYAWNDVVGWLDFYTTNAFFVWGTKISGYASSALGDVSFDCATSPLGNICVASNYGVCNGPGPHQSDGSCPLGDAGDSTGGAVTGYTWNDTAGWISMNCDQTSHGGSNQCGTSNYKVTINSSGDFSGWAWSDAVGWISVNCSNPGTSCPPNYKMNTNWRGTSSIAFLESSTFDTQVTPGGVLNSIIWQGTLPNGTCVDFQIATSSNPSGPWTYRGPGGAADQYFGASCAAGFAGGLGCAAPNTPVCVNPNLVRDAHYLRYRVRLLSDRLQTVSPQIDDIILNWSR